MRRFVPLLFPTRFVTPGPEATDKLDIKSVHINYSTTVLVPVCQIGLYNLDSRNGSMKQKFKVPFRSCILGGPL